MASSLKELMDAVQEGPATEEWELAPDRTVVISGITSFSQGTTLARKIEEYKQHRKGIQVMWGGKPVELTDLVVQTAVITMMSVVDPELTFEQAVLLGERFGKSYVALNNRVMELSGDKLQEQIDAAKETLNINPSEPPALPCVENTDTDTQTATV